MDNGLQSYIKSIIGNHPRKPEMQILYSLSRALLLYQFWCILIKCFCSLNMLCSCSRLDLVGRWSGSGARQKMWLGHQEFDWALWPPNNKCHSKQSTGQEGFFIYLFIYTQFLSLGDAVAFILKDHSRMLGEQMTCGVRSSSVPRWRLMRGCECYFVTECCSWREISCFLSLSCLRLFLLRFRPVLVFWFKRRS